MTDQDRDERWQSELRRVEQLTEVRINALDRRVRNSEMTSLETLVRDGTRRSLTHGLGRACELLADELVYELLRDPAMKAELVGLMRQALIETLTSLPQRRSAAGADTEER
jgi:hypothetical protein